MTSKLTRERLEEIRDYDTCVTLEESAELARMTLAAMNSEPVFFIEVEGDDWINAGRIEGKNRPDLGLLPDGINYLYAGPQTALERNQVRREHAEWSQATFGNVGPIGPLKHLSKEALEAAAEPGDLSEWADMQFLLWDAQRRAGITDEQITQAMIEKLAVNKQREWPEPKDGEPRLHIKAQPAPVVQMVPEEPPEHLLPKGTSRDATHRRGAAIQAWKECRAAMLQAGISAVIPDGYVMVPKEPTEAMMLHKSGCQHHAWDDPDCAMRQTRRLIWSHMLAAAPQLPGSEPATVPDRWIPVSEQMPGSQEWVIVFAKWANQQVLCWDDVQNRWTDFEDQSYYADMFSHWMPLPAAPQEARGDINALIPLVSRNEQEVK